MAYSFYHSPVHDEAFVRLQDETHIIAVKQVERLNKQHDLSRFNGGMLLWAYQPFVIPIHPILGFLPISPYILLSLCDIKAFIQA